MQVSVETKLTQARVYRHGAVLTRVGTVSLEQGMNKVYLTGIPRAINRDSLRAKFPSLVERGTVRIVNSLPDELIAGPVEEAVALQRRIAELDRRIRNREDMRELWKRNADFTGASKVPNEKRIAFLTELPQQLDAIDAEIAQLEDERRQAFDAFQKLAPGCDPESTLAGLSTAAPEPQSAVLLEVQAGGTGECTFELQYQTSEAWWQPLYEIYADGLGKPLHLCLRGDVHQRTGEDWEQVALSLSCGDMNTAFAQGQLQPVYLDFSKPFTKSQAGMAFGSARAVGSAEAFDTTPMVLEDGAMPDEALAELAMPQATREDGQISATYELPGAWDVETYGEGRVVDIETNVLVADYRMLCIPVSDDAAYLTATLRDAVDMDLFTCKASIYFEGNFMGSVQLDPERVAAGDALPLGRDERIRVVRKQSRSFTSNTRLSGKTKTEYAFTIEVHNRRSAAVPITVLDRVPVSRNSDIEVAVENDGGGTIDETTGVIRWDIEVEAAMSRAFEFSYTVTGPKGKEIEERYGAGVIALACTEA